MAGRRRAPAQADRDRSDQAVLRLGTAVADRQLRALSSGEPSDRHYLRESDGAGGADTGLAVAASSPGIWAAAPARGLEPPFRYQGRDLRARRADRARQPLGFFARRVTKEIVLRGAHRVEALL